MYTRGCQLDNTGHLTLSYLSILVGKISPVFLQILEYLLTDKGF